MSLNTNKGLFIAKRLANNSVSIEFQDALDTNFKKHYLEITSLSVSQDNVDAFIRVGAGNTYLDSAAYSWRNMRFENTPVGNSDTSADEIKIIHNDLSLRDNASDPIEIELNIFNARNSQLATYINGDVTLVDGSAERSFLNSSRLVASDDSSIIFYLSAGVIVSGEFCLYGQ